jgi:mannose-6-phosphate isomerase-like protein (cupin superfamily)
MSRRIVTGHDSRGKSAILSDGLPPQLHPMQGAEVGADFVEIWSDPASVPVMQAAVASEPTARVFTMMPPSGHLLRIIDVYPLSRGGSRTLMHQTSTLDYVVVIEGELTLILDDSEVTLTPGEVVVQRGTLHAWENRSDQNAKAAFFHLAATFDDGLLDILPKPLELMR